MIYLLIVLLIAILAFLLFQQKQSEIAWQKELAMLRAKSEENQENRVEETEVDVPSNPSEQAAIDSPTEKPVTLELPFHYLDTDTESENSEEIKTNLQEMTLENYPSIEKKPIENQEIINKESLFNTTESIPKERQTITLEEATRFLRRPLNEVEQEDDFRPDVVVTAHGNAPIITLDDPNIARVRHRTRVEKRILLQKENPTATQIATPKKFTEQPEPEKASLNLPPMPQSDNELLPLTQSLEVHAHKVNTVKKTKSSIAEKKATIEAHDIQENLVRQRNAKKKLAEKNAPKQAERLIEPLDLLEEIPTDEVWANLSKTHIPNSRRQRNTLRQTVASMKNAAANVSARITPQNRYAPQNQPEYGVSIPEPVVVPHEPMPEPEIVEPVYFSANQRQMTPAPIYANAHETDEPTPSFQVASSSNDMEEESHLTEEDFARYYQSENNEIDNEATSWASTLAQDENHRLPENILPPLSLLLPPVHDPKAVQSQEALLENSIIIEEKLAEFRVKVKVLDAYAGPVITRYEIEPDVGVRGNSVLNLEKDLARSLGVAAIRVVETIPGKTCMGLELPNPKRQMIRLSEVFNSPEFSGSQSKLTLALGQDITGAPVVTDLAKAPHLLVAGTTGSGKSVGVNSMILSMLYKATPEDVRMIMIDPKMLELSIYEGIPHLLAPVVTDMKLAANALTWCVNEMEKRYRLMSHVGVRNLASYNQKISEAAARGKKIGNPFSLTPQDPEPLEKLPFIVVVVDEFADLMMVAGKQIEQLIARLAQKARAAGIHLILATQRPSVDVITGLIKANIPTRIAFQVSTKIDSRTILDQIGAENLLGQGDMLFLPPGTGYPQRVHGAFVADSEVHAIVEYLKQFGEPDYIDDILRPEQEEFNFGGNGNSSSERDPLFDQAVEVIVRTKKATISSLQRHLRIGYNKAATLMDQLEAEGIISAADHTGKRTILARANSQD
ncbi:DNA translocase FtsK [Neisseriaceae bacterium B1]